MHNDNSDKTLHVLDILNEMRRIGLESEFIFSLMEHCQKYEGIRDLMEMWYEEIDKRERDKLIQDLRECLDDIATFPKKPEKLPYICFDDLDEARRDILEFKKRLREEVDRQGGISSLARKTGIPQPSLSRFFTSSSLPRRTTLYKIAKALHLPEACTSFKWAR